jgi:hypothetical protein
MSMNQETCDIVKHKPIFTPKSAVLKLHISTKIMVSIRLCLDAKKKIVADKIVGIAALNYL